MSGCSTYCPHFRNILCAGRFRGRSIIVVINCLVPRWRHQCRIFASAKVIFVSSFVTHNSFLPNNHGLVAFLVGSLCRSSLIIPRFVVGDFQRLLF
jgi:hypothetical protein